MSERSRNLLLESADGLVQAAQIGAAGMFISMTERFPPLRETETEWWDFVYTVAGVFVATSRLSELHLTAEAESELLTVIEARLAEWHPKAIQGFEDCKQLFEREYDRLTSADYEHESIASDSLGIWIVWNLFDRQPQTDEELQLVRVVGAAITHTFFDWWKDGLKAGHKNAGPSKAEGFGGLISAFVDERVGGPETGEDLDFWCEAVYAALFSVAYRLIPYCSKNDNSPEQMAESVKTLFQDVDWESRKWVQSRLGLAARKRMDQSVSFELAGEIASRLTMYYNIASEAIDERGFSWDSASSHAVFVGLYGWTEQQIMHGRSTAPKEWSEAIRRVTEMCLSLESEAARAIQKRIDQKTKNTDVWRGGHDFSHGS